VLVPFVIINCRIEVRRSSLAIPLRSRRYGESEEKLGEELRLLASSPTCSSTDEALLRVKSGIFCGNSDLLHYLSVAYITVVYGFHRLVRVL